jgi:hypothetical protein
MSKREINFDEIKEGDEIEIVDTATEKITRVGANWLYTSNIQAYKDVEEFWTRKFYLLNRPLPKHKYAVGQKVVDKDGDVLTIIQLNGYSDNDEPTYALVTKQDGLIVWRESELTPVEEEVWLPSIGEFVSLEVEVEAMRVLIIRSSNNGRPSMTKVGDGDKEWWVPTDKLSPWKEAQP